MGNIRQMTPPVDFKDVKITIGGEELAGSLFQNVQHANVDINSNDFGAAIQLGLDRARQERDAERFAEPLDAGLSQALREVHATDMPGAEKLRAVQALMRATDENHCAECGGDGWVVVNQCFGNPAGEQESCPSCESPEFRDVFDPQVGVFVQTRVRK